MTKNNNKEFNSFASFYPYYLAEHKNKTCRRLHFIGSTLVLLILLFALVFAHWSLLWLLPIVGYGFAWVGHFFFEKNKPATFQYPLYSLMGDWVMYKDIIRGKVPW
ncbi:hypothetical protein CBQ28_19045 [Pseudoalteromonas sp. GCY]|uniref:DUF962 domain-containing protein n=1 Tax=Pseudoalteromonas sp. GCY TaxID=2003316 RepID=UPI000BFEC7FF|nr:DUF962 domain-containing protein [Pseudoalteromonas sp. GCY]PHI35500.1 hypothetical protein CBQ28_19045 [Pseudoalteromonas sp. GCY]QQQ68459.1 DUF962 domain-containing protein [Pseudoalteromonas sp. GCY]